MMKVGIERIPFRWSRNPLFSFFTDRIFCGEPIPTSPENALGCRTMNERGERQSERAARLAAALRANLGRRKKQAVARTRGPGPHGSPAPPAPPHDSAEIVAEKPAD
jgi:hypothetical protein